MKMFLEEKSGEDIIQIKEVRDKAEAIEEKKAEVESYIHYCFHDEKDNKSCKRVKL